MLVQNKEGESAVQEWVDLDNGCVCCTVKGTLIQTIDGLLARRAETGKTFDFILLETTGLADPGPIAQELWVDDELLEENGAVLDAVVTLVDASNIRRQLREGKEAELQIAHADTLVLNKTDLVSEADLDEVERVLTGINTEARVVRSCRSQVDLGVVLNQGAVTVDGRRGVRPLLGKFAQATPSAVMQQGRGFWAKGVERYMPANAGPSAVHDVAIRTVCLAVEGRIDLRRFESWLEEMLWEQNAGGEVEGGEGDPPLEVLRAKGVLFVAEEGDGGEVREVKKVLQAVREVYEITPAPPLESPNEQKLNKVVLIGRGLREDDLIRGLQETTVKAA